MTNGLTLSATPPQPAPSFDGCQPVRRDAKVTWLFNCIGTPDSLLYWNEILPRYLQRFPRSEFWTARPPAKRIAGTDRFVQCAGSWRIYLGKRRGSYDRQIVIPAPGILVSLKRSRPDLVIVQELLAYAIYLACFRDLLPDTRLLLLLESDPIRQIPRRKQRWVGWLRRWAVRRMDWCLTNNDSGRDYLTRELGFPPHRVLVQPYLVSQPPGVAHATDLSGLPAVAQEDLGKPIFLSVGQLIERKGIRQLIEAVSRLAPDLRREARVWVVGDGALRGPLQQLVAQMGLQEQFRFWGAVPYDQLSQYYRAANCFVMPTLDDYRALVGFEALAYGLPLLHSRYDGAAPELIVEGANGYIVDPRNPAEFAARLAEMLRRRDEWPGMGQVSARRAAEHFTVARAVDNLSAAIARVLADGTCREPERPCAC
jgi:glycosyltransferase involved in cell wall biosynthesis